MTAKILDGKALAERLRLDLSVRVERLTRSRRPGLAVILVGDDGASQIYVRNKIKACAAVGIASRLERLSAATSQDELLGVVARLNGDEAVDGILVQMPLPPQIDPARVIEAIAIGKDVDGFHTLSAGALVTGRIDVAGESTGFKPCTPFGIMRMLDDARVPIAGSHAVVIGRSNTVGKPMALMLLAANATVTICHSATRDLAGFVRAADIVVSAVGRVRTVTGDMVKPGAAVVDVGMNRDADGKLAGDVDFEAVRQVAGWISPVPGGVGPMTIAMLMENAVLSAERSATSNRTRT
jgi:methylenetetrahydrofolate dehydrogenase (NADP+)/methenyltetrahydrofolate cyclohydrolase